MFHAMMEKMQQSGERAAEEALSQKAARESALSKEEIEEQAERDRQGEALWHAAKNEDMTKLELAVAAGADLNWPNPRVVSERREG